MVPGEMTDAAESNPPSRPRAQRGARRGDILSRASALFVAHGVHAVTTRQIAAAVGISQPSLYAHFPTKQAIVEAVCAEAFAALAEGMARTLDDVRGPAVLERLARAYVGFALEQRDAYRIALMDEGTYAFADPDANPAMEAGIAVYRIYRAAIIRELGAGLSGQDQDMLAQSYWASLHGLVALLIARPTFHWCDRERLIAFHIARLHPAAAGA